MTRDIEHFPFKYFDSVRQRWLQARYKATREQIVERYEKWEITGPGSIQSGGTGQFEPPASGQ